MPKSTLYDHVAGGIKRCGAGRLTVLTEEEEKSVVRISQELAQSGFGLDRFLVGKVIRDYLTSQGHESPFRDGLPGQKWWAGFLRRWPSLSKRKPQYFPSNRAYQPLKQWINSSQTYKDFFAKNKHSGLSYSELRRRVWNADETGVCTMVSSRKILAKRGQRDVHETGGGSGRDYIIILCCGSAIGEKLQPFIVYKGKNLMTKH